MPQTEAILSLPQTLRQPGITTLRFYADMRSGLASLSALVASFRAASIHSQPIFPLRHVMQLDCPICLSSFISAADGRHIFTPRSATDLTRFFVARGNRA